MSLPVSFSARPILCYVTDRKSLALKPGDDQLDALLARIRATAAAAVDWIQIREKDLSGKECSMLTREAILKTRVSTDAANQPHRTAARILVNDRLDVALAESAGGIHLGEYSLPVVDVRRRLRKNPESHGGKKILVGVSCHSLEDAIAAAGSGAEYIFFGPVFATPSKATHGAPQGLMRLKEVCSAVAIPVLAIGGITCGNASSCMANGAAGIAAIRLFQDAEDPASLVRELHALTR